MRFGSSIVLALVLGGLVWALMSTRRDPNAEPDGLMKPVLGGRKLLNAQKITITRGDQVIEITREGNVFRLTEPIVDLASAARLSAIAGVYDTAQMEVAEFGVAVDEKIMRETGLVDPLAFIEASYEDGFTAKLALGLPTALSHMMYAMSGDQIRLVSRALHSCLEVNASDLRERMVFRTQTAGEVQHIAITQRTREGEETLTLVRRGREFIPEGKVDFRLDQARVNQVINGVLSLGADEFIQGSLSLPPMSVPDYIVEIKGAMGDERVDLYRQSGAVIGKASPRNIAFAVKNAKFEAVLKVPLALLRATWLIPGRVDEAKKISIEHGSAVLTLERGSAGQFELREPTRVRARSQATADLVRAFGRLGVKSFREDGASDLARYGLDQDYVQVSVYGRLSRTPTVILIGGDADEESSYAKRADENHVVTIPKDVAEVMRRPWTDYVHRQVLQITAATQVMKIRLTDHAESPAKSIDYDKVEGEWKLRGSGPERDDVAEFFDDDLRDLTGTAVIDPGHRDLGKAIDLEFMAANGSVLHSVHLFRAQPAASNSRLWARRGEPNAGVILYELKIRHSEKLLALLRD